MPVPAPAPTPAAGPVTYNLAAAYANLYLNNGSNSYQLFQFVDTGGSLQPTGPSVPFVSTVTAENKPNLFRTERDITVNGQMFETDFRETLDPLTETTWAGLGAASALDHDTLPVAASIGDQGLMATRTFNAGTIGLQRGYIGWFTSWRLILAPSGTTSAMWCVDQVVGSPMNNVDPSQQRHECTEVSPAGDILARKQFTWVSGGSLATITYRNY